MVVVGGTVTVEEGAAAHGDFVVVGGVLNAPPGFFADGTQVVIGTPAVGETLRGLVPWVMHGLLLGRLIVPGLWWIWMVVGVVFLVGLLVNTLFDRPVRACADAVTSRPFSSFLLGLFVLLVTPVALVILAASVIGIVVVPFVVCAIVAAAIVGIGRVRPPPRAGGLRDRLRPALRRLHGPDRRDRHLGDRWSARPRRRGDHVPGGHEAGASRAAAGPAGAGSAGAAGVPDAASVRHAASGGARRLRVRSAGCRS
jgi:hypothetical protein